MYPDSLYANARGSFERPVPPPVSGPSDSPTSSITINCEWLPYIRGALQQLLLQSTWQDVFPGLDLTQQRVFDLIDLFQECSTPLPPFICPFDFTTSGDGLPFEEVAYGDLVGPWASFVTTVGFSSVSSLEPGGDDYWQNVSISWPLGMTVSIAIVECALAGKISGDNWSDDYHVATSGIDLYLAGSLITSHRVVSSTIPDGDSTFSHDFGGVNCDEIRLQFLAGVSEFSPAAGQVIIAGVIASGHASSTPC